MSREFGQAPFLALPGTASDGIELDQSLTLRVRSCRCAQLFLDILHQSRALHRLPLREQDFRTQGLRVRAQTVRLRSEDENEVVPRRRQFLLGFFGAIHRNQSAPNKRVCRKLPHP